MNDSEDFDRREPESVRHNIRRACDDKFARSTTATPPPSLREVDEPIDRTHYNFSLTVSGGRAIFRNESVQVRKLPARQASPDEFVLHFFLRFLDHEATIFTTSLWGITSPASAARMPSSINARWYSWSERY